MEVIRDKDGNAIRRSRNLAGVRRYVSTGPAIDRIALDTVGTGDRPELKEGKLSILFADGSSFETNFASFSVLCGWVRRWRNAHGAPLTVLGADAGTVHSTNSSLTHHADR